LKVLNFKIDFQDLEKVFQDLEKVILPKCTLGIEKVWNF